ncbi:MAG: hypothetical protein PSV35_01775 [bacterium]|nr:hypothetical protein [bacterium]
MKLKNIPIDPKKIPYYLALILLTTGASIILGFLSFGGMYALLPFLPLAFAAFGLSVAYEGEIYLQNIKGAMGKLFKSTYLENHLGKEYLLSQFPADSQASDCPQFFKDYQAQLKLLSAFGHKELNKESRQRKKQVTKTLSDMEQWFALNLFPDSNKSATTTSAYATQLRLWLAQHQQNEWRDRLENRRFMFNLVKGFSILSALFMGLGSTYLIVEAFTVIPFFAAIPFVFWPFIIVPMAIIAGAAYGMLTYNAVTDLINNNTVVKWYQKLRDDLSQGLTPRNIFMTSTALLLVALAIALTICTAGTWWTVATNARPLFDWMKRMPSFIMGAINPLITGASAIFFNIQNTAESLEMVDEATRSKTNIGQRIYRAVTDGFQQLKDTEHWLQIINPFRLLLKLTITPLRIILFIGHLLSIAVTSDRMPGMSQILSALIAIISEGFEDAHYFIGHNHDHEEEAHEHGGHSHHHDDDEHPHHDELHQHLKDRLDTAEGHNHNTDIPTWMLKTLTIPLYALAALWDSAASQLNHQHSHTLDAVAHHHSHSPQVLSFAQAWNKQRGIATETNVDFCSHAQRPSPEWQVEHVITQIDKHETKHLQAVNVGRELAAAKIAQLQQLKEKIRAPQANSLKELLEQEKDKPIYNQHRLFAQEGAKTTTQEFLEELPARANLVG